MVAHPRHLRYSGRHMWVSIHDTEATVGVTEDLQHLISEIESVDLPMIDDEVEMDIECMAFHLATELHHLICPLTGRVTAVNEALLDHPERVFLSPYKDGWLFKMEVDEPDELEMLMSSDEYVAFLEENEE
jgi:glycine cleavage system H protein